VIIAGLCGLAVLALLTAPWRNHVLVTGARVIAALGVAAVIWGWGVAQYPVLLPGTAVTLTNAGAPHTTLVAIIWLFVAAVLLVGPAFALLFALQGRRLLYADDAGLALAGVPGGATRPPAGPPGQQPAFASPGSGSRAVVLGLVAAGAIVRALIRRRDR
jgi:cytochrome d ubiquinol oxidase subunit II